MAQKSTQNLQNHARYVPMFHFLLLALLGTNLFHAARTLLPVTQESAYRLLVALALGLMYFYIRQFPVTVQDRVIRLEERLRLREQAPDIAARLEEFTPGQLAALRFASDAELPALAADVLAGKLRSSGDIKKAIKVWRPDELRA